MKYIVITIIKLEKTIIDIRKTSTDLYLEKHAGKLLSLYISKTFLRSKATL